MKKSGKRELIMGGILIVAFVIWTVLIQVLDVQPVGTNGSKVGFATLNCWFHNFTGVNLAIYTITDWLGLVPLFVCIMFWGIGFVQLIKRKSLLKVDCDLTFLGMHYIMVIFVFLIFEIFPINYRPILIEGVMEASYPSSTTLLVLSVMPTLNFHINQRLESGVVKKIICVLSYIFSAFMVIGRMICGVHWLTDIVGSVMISVGLFCVYKAAVLFARKMSA